MKIIFTFWLRLFLLLTFISFLGKVGFTLATEILTIKEAFYPLVWGLRFDFAVAAFFAFFASLLLVFKSVPTSQVKFFISFFAVLILILFVSGDYLYFLESGRHITYEAKDAFNHGQTFFALVQITLRKPLALTAALIFSWAAAKLISAGIKSKESKKVIAWPKRSLLLMTLLIPSTFFFRGGIDGIPQDPAKSYQLGSPQAAAAALSGGYSVLFGLLNSNQLYKERFFLPFEPPYVDKIPELYQLDLNIALENSEKPTFELKPNIVVVLLEGWTTAYSRSYSEDYNDTPYFDQIRKGSLSPAFTIAGGHRTTEGIFSAFCSLQNPLGKTLALTHLAALPFRCLPEILNETGYSSIIFQGSDELTSGTGPFSQILGFQKSLGKREFKSSANRPKNKWGLFDKDLYKEVINHLKLQPEPFLAAINTNSTHDLKLPYYADKDLKKQEWQLSEETLYRNILKISDQDLFKFIKALEENFANRPLIIALVADHTSYINKSNFLHYSIPFAIKVSDFDFRLNLDFVNSQRDLAPTLLELIDEKEKIPAHWQGQSLLTPYKKRFGEFFHLGLMGWASNKRIVEFGMTLAASPVCYQIKTKPFSINKDTCTPRDIEEKKLANAFTQVWQNLLFNERPQDFSLFKQKNP